MFSNLYNRTKTTHIDPMVAMQYGKISLTMPQIGTCKNLNERPCQTINPKIFTETMLAAIT